MKWQASSLLVSAFVLVACDQPPSYYGTEEEWRRDSATVDSLSRLVNTDSLFLAYRQSLTDTNYQAAHQQIKCLRSRLLLQHGTYPSGLAIDRMMDTLWRGVDPQIIADHDARVPAALFVGIDSARCGTPSAMWKHWKSLPPIVERVDPSQPRPER